jgi:hypothetical protein
MTSRGAKPIRHPGLHTHRRGPHTHATCVAPSNTPIIELEPRGPDTTALAGLKSATVISEMNAKFFSIEVSPHLPMGLPPWCQRIFLTH